MVSEAGDNKTEEKYSLFLVCEVLVRTEEALREKDFALAQGALRGAYNSLGKLIYNSEYLSNDRKKLLEKVNNNILGIRDYLVSGVETGKSDLAEFVNSGDIYRRLGSAKAALERYVGYWYPSNS